MKKKNKIILILGIIIIFITIVGVAFYFVFKDMTLELGGNTLDTDHYQTAVEVNSNAEFILLFNKKNKVSNIIYLNDQSVESLYHKKIEGKSIEEAMKLVVENLKNNDIFTDDKNVILINYGNSEIFSKVEEELNKEFVIYGINKQITTDKTTLKDKLSDLDLEIKEEQEKNLKALYYHSLDVISRYQKNKESTTQSNIEEENINTYAMNIYNKLLTYSTGITTQSKDDINGIDITTINATGDYQNELYATSDSWYYIDNSKVYAYIHFNYDNLNYEYCFKGSNSYSIGNCQ